MYHSTLAESTPHNKRAKNDDSSQQGFPAADKAADSPLGMTFVINGYPLLH